MFKFVIGRTATMHDLPVGKEMGVNTWAAFAGRDEDRILVTEAFSPQHPANYADALRKAGLPE